MNRKIKNILKKTWIYDIILKNRAKKSLTKWVKAGKPVPPPQAYKQKIIKEYATKYNISTLIETGTYQGETIRNVRNSFKIIYSIELDKVLYQNAKNSFKQFKDITIVNGDSGEKIFEIINKIDVPCLFWLDGHYSEGITSKGDLNTPILQELNHILNHHIKNHIILIDDARCFIGKNDYPSIENLKKFITEKNPDLNIKIKHDIIRITENQ